MTGNQSQEIKDQAEVAVAPAENKIAAIIDDPFASMFAGTVSVAIAFSVVVGDSALVSALL